MIPAQQFVLEFADSVAAQTDAIKAGDHKAGNRFAKRYIRAFRKLCAIDDGRDALAELFSHPRRDVRTMAAAFLLRNRTAEASAVLREAAQGEGIVAFEARQTLKRWEEGTWDLDGR